MHSPRMLKRMGIVTALMLRFTALGLVGASVAVPVGTAAADQSLSLVGP